MEIIQSPSLKEKISSLPNLPGVYIFKDKDARILYVGKARSLKKRVQSYFNRPVNAKTQVLVSKIEKLDYLLTDSEAQALVKEAALIKEYLPPYNISLKDDKSFPYICLSREDLPFVRICRKKKKTPDLDYFGPYPNVKLLRQAYKVIRRIFTFRTCLNMPSKPCLYYRIHLCPAPCAGKISYAGYRRIIGNIRMFLNGKQEALADALSRQMHEAAKEHKYETAASLRDQLGALAQVSYSSPSLSQSIRESEELKIALGLKKRPQRIEAFDVSNISGQQSCASMVSFYEGRPDKNNYRRFRIKTVSGPDDYRSLQEAIFRRYRRLIEEGAAFPDLIVIDGGKGQLGAAQAVLDELKAYIPAIGIAKENEEIFSSSTGRGLRLGMDSPALHLIQRARDEAHRFAVAYHRVLRRKKMIGR
ncbi:MAG: excinuclease ABC subunit UvrC [Candidatus Omnitrophota bacterium]